MSRLNPDTPVTQDGVGANSGIREMSLTSQQHVKVGDRILQDGSFGTRWSLDLHHTLWSSVRLS